MKPENCCRKEKNWSNYPNAVSSQSHKLSGTYNTLLIASLYQWWFERKKKYKSEKEEAIKNVAKYESVIKKLEERIDTPDFDIDELDRIEQQIAGIVKVCKDFSDSFN
mgnify:CR=1 FL=1